MRTVNRLSLALLVMVVSTNASAQQRTHRPQKTTAAITERDLKTRLYIFADDSMGGRAAGTADNLRGTAYIARELRRMGVQPAGEKGSYFQDIPLFERRISPKSWVRVNGKTFSSGPDFISRDNGWATRPLLETLAVYGGALGDTSRLLAPGAAAGNVVVLTIPAGWRADRGLLTRRYAEAAALVVAVLDSIPANVKHEFSNAASLEMRPDKLSSGPSYFFASHVLAQAMFGGRRPADLPVGTIGTAVNGLIAYSAERKPGRNVIAVIRGSDRRLRHQYVALGAHNDHDPLMPFAVDHDSLRAFDIVARPGGVESPNTEVTQQQWTQIRHMIDSLRALRPPRLDSIKNGADDDGSGSMALLEIAEAFAAAKVKPKRSLLFVWHTGEELGMFGSRYFTDHPTVPRDSIVAQLNLDMIGRSTPGGLPLIGAKRLSTELGEIITEVNSAQPAPLKFDYSLDAVGEPHQYYCRSDHYMYARYGIPIAFFFDAGHADYHEVTDEPQYIDYPDYSRVVKLVHAVTSKIANLDHRIVVDGPKPDPNGRCVQ